MKARPQAIFDCNVFLQAMLSERGPSHACWQLVRQGAVKLDIAPFIVAEVLQLPRHKKLQRFTQFSSIIVERFIAELLTRAELHRDPPPRFVYPRDPDDARYVDLAIATGARLIVSNDRDLLDLMDVLQAEGAALRAMLPPLLVVTPAEFLAMVARP